jgi:uncharacterized membrane protein YraQ (UPF0718 family)
MAGAKVIDSNTWIVLALLGALAALAFWRGGAELVGAGLGSGARLLLRFALVIALSFLAAGLAEVLVPREWVGRALGADSGLRGLLLASAAGALTPAGPFVSMPIAVALLRAGAGTAPVVAYVTAWMLISLHRLVAWEMPIMGTRFSLLRFGVCLALPMLAGLGARLVARA